MSSPGTDPSQTLHAGAVFAMRYRVTRFIGKGGMGSVYEVLDERTGGVRALKIMSAATARSNSLRARFEQEARIASRVESEHLVRIFDVGAEDNQPFIVMELLRGEDLESVLKRRRLDPVEAITYLRQVSRALERTHAANVVHRDIKPENLFLTQRDDGSGCIKILDFGIAKVVDRGSQSHTRVVGTPLYMAPEQVEGVGEVGPAADIHALGHVAFTLLAGFPYWEIEAPEGPMALMIRLLKGPVESPSVRAARRGVALAPGFDAWFARTAAVSPAARWPNVRDAIDALSAIHGVVSDGVASAPGTFASESSVDTRASAPGPASLTQDGSLGSASTMVAGTPGSAIGPAQLQRLMYGAPPTSQVVSSPMAYSGVMPIPSSAEDAGITVIGGPPSMTQIGPGPMFPPGATVTAAVPAQPGQPGEQTSRSVGAAQPAKAERKHSPISLIAGGACIVLLAVGFVVVIVLGVQRGQKKGAASSEPSASSTSAARVGPCRSGHQACKEIGQSRATLDGAKLLDHAEMLAREIDKDAKLYQVDLQSAVYQGRVDAKEGRVSMMFGANGKAIVVSIQGSELVADATPNVALPPVVLPRPTCSVANAWTTAVQSGLDGTVRLSMYLHSDRRGKAWQVHDDTGKIAYVNTATCDPM